MRDTVQRNTRYKGPGPKGSPKKAIVKRWSAGSFLFARLECGHEVRLTKEYEWEPGTMIPCPECPRKRKRR